MSATPTSSATASAKPKAPAQSILDDHHDPTQVNANDPIVLFIIQVTFIVVLCRLLAIPLRKIRQPMVISEVIGGILLGPSVFGQIDGFTQHIFPKASLTYLNLVSTIGLVLFLFLVGLEVDFKVFRSNARASLAISVVGMVIPFGLGALVSIGIYHNFVDDSQVDFGTFLLFVGVAMAITAFPVLARILTELKLLGDDVGLTVLAAGVGNDVVGWVLLALAVALANASNGVTAVYILLCAVGWTLVLFFLVKPAFHWFVRRSGGRVTAGVMTVMLLLTLASAWVTDVIGVHAIFGGFLVGLIMPKGQGFEAQVAEKIEDFIGILLLPIYFALSGLRTDLSLLANGSIWGWTICVIVVAFLSKFLGCATTAYFFGFKRRESLAVGALMSCKGLVELIVLNVGLTAGILNNEVFAMFVVMALVTTFASTPLTLWFYPVPYRQRRALEKAGLSPDSQVTDSGAGAKLVGAEEGKSRFLFVLSAFEHLPPVMGFIKLLSASSSISRGSGQVETRNLGSASDSDRKSIEEQDRKSSDFVPTTPLTVEVPTKVDALRLVELTQRSSAVFKASETDPRPDPLDGIFNTFVNLSGLSGTTSSALVDSGEFSTAVSSTVNERRSELVILPWATKFEEKEKADRFPVYNPFGGIWRTDSVAEDDGASYYSSFVRNVFRDSEVDVAVLLDRTFSSKNGSGAKLFLPFFGGPDDRAALELLVQLCRKKGVYGAVVRIERREGLEEDELEKKLSATSDSTEGGSHLKPGPAALEFMKKVSAGATGTVGHGATVMPDTVYGHQDTATKMISDSADSILLNRYFPTSNSEEVAHSASVQAALSRISYEVVRTSAPLRIALQRIEHACTAEGTKGSATLVLTGRGRRSAESHAAEESMFLKEYVATRGHGALGICSSSDVRRTLGAVGTGATVKGLGDGVLVVQAALTSPEAAKRNV
ncbi:hypothetical protein BT69DRAFT_1337391 [Atractiella rhizophila]|nr:hypothetical protein BT69DRAFT_1337391 [Atractiella rhizophila]